MPREHDSHEDGDRATPKRAGTRAWYLLLVLTPIGVLIPPIYNSKHPLLIGIPFFYWYLLLWVPVTAFCMLIVYRRTKDDQ